MSFCINILLLILMYDIRIEFINATESYDTKCLFTSQYVISNAHFVATVAEAYSIRFIYFTYLFIYFRNY